MLAGAARSPRSSTCSRIRRPDGRANARASRSRRSRRVLPKPDAKRAYSICGRKPMMDAARRRSSALGVRISAPSTPNVQLRLRRASHAPRLRPEAGPIATALAVVALSALFAALRTLE